VGKSKSKKKLSPICQKIAELVKSAGGQQAFADSIGFSQSLVSRLVNGQQEPRADLIAAIGDLPGVKRDELFELANLVALDDDAQVAVFHCLLEGEPDDHSELRTGEAIAVPSSLFRRSIYAVKGRVCTPANLDRDECIQPEDVVIIETRLADLQNVQRLDGKLCAIAVGSKKDRTITLRRVFTEFDARKKTTVLKFCSDARFDQLVKKRRNRDSRRRDHRQINLDDPSESPIEDFLDQVAKRDSIVGVAIQMIRQL
jgi:transcriptional regulator with XRE-family HTH domain